MLLDQSANNHDDLRKVTDNILRDAASPSRTAGQGDLRRCKDPVRKTVMKVARDIGRAGRQRRGRGGDLERADR